MYNERKESFSFKDVLIQFLFVALFIFILLWLFPTKRDLEKAIEPLYVSIFNENVASMREGLRIILQHLVYQKMLVIRFILL